MRFSATVFLSFVASALAYRVTVPSEYEGWTTSGAQDLVWDRVDTDANTFGVILTNVNYPLQEVLANHVDGTSGNSLFVYPSQGHTGSGFRVNLVKDTPSGPEINTIFAQSNQFTIA